jgi:hypothetical protein
MTLLTLFKVLKVGKFLHCQSSTFCKSPLYVKAIGQIVLYLL